MVLRLVEQADKTLILVIVVDLTFFFFSLLFRQRSEREKEFRFVFRERTRTKETTTSSSSWSHFERVPDTSEQRLRLCGVPRGMGEAMRYVEPALFSFRRHQMIILLVTVARGHRSSQPPVVIKLSFHVRKHKIKYKRAGRASQSTQTKRITQKSAKNRKNAFMNPMRGIIRV
mgnify:CR=1 FL=1